MKKNNQFKMSMFYVLIFFLQKQIFQQDFLLFCFLLFFPFFHVRVLLFINNIDFWFDARVASHFPLFQAQSCVAGCLFWSWFFWYAYVHFKNEHKYTKRLWCNFLFYACLDFLKTPYFVMQQSYVLALTNNAFNFHRDIFCVCL